MKKYIVGFSLIVFLFGVSLLMHDFDMRKAERRYSEQGEVARVMVFKNMEEREEASEDSAGKPESNAFAFADIEFSTQGGTRVAVARWPISKELLERIGNGERIEIEYLRDDPHTIRLPGKPYKGLGWKGYIVYLAITLGAAWLVLGMFRSPANR